MIGHFSHFGSSLARDSDCILFQPEMNHQPVGALGSKAKGGLLGESVEQQGLRRLPHMEYQKSSAALDLATQLVVGGKFMNTIPAVRSWVRMGLVGG